MGPPDVLDMFENHICHQKMLRNDFRKIDFFVNFQLFHLWASGQKPQKTAKNRHKPRKTIEIGSSSPTLFQKKMAAVNFWYFRNVTKICDFGPKSENGNISQSVVFVAFVAFLGTTMLIFENFKMWRCC